MRTDNTPAYTLHEGRKKDELVESFINRWIGEERDNVRDPKDQILVDIISSIDIDERRKQRYNEDSINQLKVLINDENQKPKETKNHVYIATLINDLQSLTSQIINV